MTANMTATAGLKYYATPTFQTPPTMFSWQLHCKFISDSSSALKCKCTAVKCKIWARKIKAAINLVYYLLASNTVCTQNFKIKIHVYKCV